MLRSADLSTVKPPKFGGFTVERSAVIERKKFQSASAVAIGLDLATPTCHSIMMCVAQ